MAFLIMAVVPEVFGAAAGTLSGTPGGGEAPGAPVREARIVREYPHDRNAYTQGLLFRAGFIYESTGLHGRSTLREVTPESGTVRRVHRMPDDQFGEGLALCGERLIQLTWRSGVIHVYDRKSFRLRGSFPYPREGWGLACDGKRLIASDGTDRLHVLDPRTFRTLRSVAVTDAGRPVSRLNELEFVEGRILANVWGSDRIARIHPDSGRVEGWIDLAALRQRLRGTTAETANGIAWDAARRRLLVTGKLWPLLFDVNIDGLDR
ncbi:MAG: glutamine cyclotransferase [Deltaproteobacteria bacterium HGW-Deltaproteobacteria-19]|jgi:glutamine cyclotransferase|nr:MAG: glutamine cyclotransferase [Deltaproteobacteria bacterium HGW-Deltaproteobacteria-19]